MKSVLHENRLDCYEKVYENEKTFEVVGESVVPDKMPDIGLLGETVAHVVLQVKRVEDGKGILEGDVQAAVCYIPDGVCDYCSLELVIPWQVEFESEAVSGRGVGVGETVIAQVETRMLNPRKILVKVLLNASLTVFEKRSLVVYDDMEENPAVQINKSEIECSVIGTVGEKTFVAADEYPLPADLIGGKILCKAVQFRVDDVKTLANKLIVKGSALSNVVVVTEQGTAEQINFTSGFSFITETDCDEVSCDVKASVMPTALYYEVSSDGKSLSVEAHGVCQMISYQKCELHYISDVYSNFYECNTETDVVSIYTNTKNIMHRETATVNMQGRSQIMEIEFVTVQLNKPTHKEAGVSVPLLLSVYVKYENGTLDRLKKQITVEMKTKEGERVQAVRVADIYGVANGIEAEIRVSMDADMREERECQLQFISAVEADEEHPFCSLRPSITVVRRGGSLWELAREFGSTVALIQAYNQLEETEAAPDTLLLIPKQIL